MKAFKNYRKIQEKESANKKNNNIYQININFNIIRVQHHLISRKYNSLAKEPKENHTINHKLETFTSSSKITELFNS
jgi:hypothetical protein